MPERSDLEGCDLTPFHRREKVETPKYFIDGFINQFGDSGELDPKEWNALEFLKWLKINNFDIIKLK